jgi:VanZ family protein
VSGRLARWVPALLWAATVFWLSSQSQLIELPYALSWDKLQHCAAYAAGGAALAHAVGGRGRGPWLAVALGVLYGASDELHQWFVPSRSSDVRDLLADAVGVLAGVFIYRTFLSWREGRVAAGAAAVRP